MKVKCTGKVLSRTSRKAPDGSTRYTIAIEEPGNIPSTFAFSTKNAAVFGPSDGFAKVGNIVTATAFANGRCEDVPRKDGSGCYVAAFNLSDSPARLTLAPQAMGAQSAEILAELGYGQQEIDALRAAGVIN